MIKKIQVMFKNWGERVHFSFSGTEPELLSIVYIENKKESAGRHKCFLRLKIKKKTIGVSERCLFALYLYVLYLKIIVLEKDTFYVQFSHNLRYII